MDGHLFTTPDRLIEAARIFSSEGYERSFEELLVAEPVPWPTRSERPLRTMRPACRPLEGSRPSVSASRVG